MGTHKVASHPAIEPCGIRKIKRISVKMRTAKSSHEFRDPIHVFVTVSDHERDLVDSKQFQRLRHIHQLGMTHLLYPGATHRRFEHSLGVLELASRVYKVVTRPDRIPNEFLELLPELRDDHSRSYWHQVIRVAALCHDLGHLPFSHTAEQELLPRNWDHERLTRKIIDDKGMRSIWDTLKLKREDVVKLALGPKKAPDLSFSDWETILAEIIVGDSFGVDRIDYLLRDSHHIGVAYGKFDHYRLIDTLRILPSPPSGELEKQQRSRELTLGIEEGGLHSAEALLLARYFMYTQVYFHRVRRIYDIHLRDFLRDWLPKGIFPINVGEHLAWTDNEINAAIWEAASNSAHRGHEHAKRIISHDHFQLMYELTPEDRNRNIEAVLKIHRAAAKEFGPENVRYDRYPEKGEPAEFPVLTSGGEIVSSTSKSQVLSSLRPASVNYVFIKRELEQKAASWLKANKEELIKPKREKT
jgi:HD superfamily phosphohydrolase